MSDEAAKGNGAEAPDAPRPVSAQFFEQDNLVHRIIVENGTKSEHLTRPGWADDLGQHTAKLNDGDLAHVFTEDWSTYWQCLVAKGGRGGQGQTQMIVLPGYPVEIPRFDRESNDGLPAGYSITYDPIRRVFVPKWGTVLLHDGYPRREDARGVVEHHKAKSASVPPKAKKVAQPA